MSDLHNQGPHQLRVFILIELQLNLHPSGCRLALDIYIREGRVLRDPGIRISGWCHASVPLHWSFEVLQKPR